MKVDVLVAEIGSTTTMVNAFCDLAGEPRFIGQGQAPTTVLDGDVRVGLRNAVDALCGNLGTDTVEYDTMFATSSAAGGLRMSVHGLVYDMTVKAAEAAALGAGAVVRMVTAGKMTDMDLEDLRDLNPNVILIAGGTDYGERETAVYNAKAVAELGLNVPVIYAGNIQNQNRIRSIFENANIPCTITENVYPKLDCLNIEPCRKVIQEVFEKHIVTAPGMEHVRDMVTGNILPTPGAVMEAVRHLYEEVGDLVCLDIGGATTDVHSVSEGSEEIAAIQMTPEPFAKRTVEGDLGMYVNARNLVQRLGASELSRELELDVDEVMANYKPIPDTPEHFRLTERLCFEAGKVSLERHAGKLRHIYLPQGRKTIAEGKDLTKVKYLVGTGGALTRLPNRMDILRRLCDCNITHMMLYPLPGKMEILVDNDYIMASLGVLSKQFPEAAVKLMKRSMGI